MISSEVPTKIGSPEQPPYKEVAGEWTNGWGALRVNHHPRTGED